ncbi:FtsX-like permease family protein [Pseudomonas sp. HUK17]|uniref:FtsX-like permease family protein n=1 Tax=Pseudomonas sp. HUK17 TaxID=1799359 RepID=UPI000799AB49|nr:FtsX-like permease family protein [Pseudomonas sp. HUK17]KXJ32974.1 ABC transporter permease [Pseudomonas sp. HUK17]
MRLLFWSLHSLVSHWRRHPLQLAGLIAGLWLATALLIGVLALNAQARQSYAQASALFGADQSSLEARDGKRFTQALFVELRRQGWPVSPVLQGRLTLAEREGTLPLLGIEPVSLPSDQGVAAGASPTALYDFLSPAGTTWIAPETLREWQLQAGQVLHRADGLPLPPLQPRPGLAPGTLVLDIGQAQRLLDAPDQLSRLILPKTFQRALPTLAGVDLHRVENDQGAELARLTDSFHLNLLALGLLAFAVGLFIVHAATGLALEQRRALLRTLRACGLSAATLVLALTLELALIALVAGALGVASGYALAALLLPDVAASLRGLYGAEVAGSLTLSSAWWLAGLGLSLGGALLAGADGLWRAARLPLLALAQGEAWRAAHGRWLRRQALGALLVGLAALVLWLGGNSLASGLALLGCLLLAAALALPPLLSALLDLLLKRARRPLSRWFLADARQQLPGLSQALMALLLALAANVGAGSMTEGFRRTFDGWLDQRLAAELYLRPQDATQAAALLDWLPRQPSVGAVLPVYELETGIQGQPSTLSGILDADLYRRHWPPLDAGGEAWTPFFAGDGLMLSEQLARRLGVVKGQRVELQGSQGRWSAPILATYADYGNPRGHVLLSQAQLRALWPEATLVRIVVRMAPPQVEALRSELQQRFGLDTSHSIDQGQLRRYADQVFERTFSATAALNALTLAVAGLALFIALLGQAQRRLGQLAPLWALGIERPRLILLSLGQLLGLALLTLALAIPLGILLAWCLVAVVNVQAFGWRLPLQVFPSQLLALSAIALLATLLAAAWPLLRLQRSQPLDLLRELGNER